jgi:hypothetical protein
MLNVCFSDDDFDLGNPAVSGHTASQLPLTPACDDTFNTNNTSSQTPYIFDDKDSGNLHLG